MRPGEVFGLALEDIGEPEFFRRQPVIQVRRQVALVQGVRCFRPVKNKKEHATPVPSEFAEMLISYMERLPPVRVTLPWLRPSGDPVTFALVITRPDRTAVHYSGFIDGDWKPALAHAGIIAARPRGAKRWEAAPSDGPHRLRHTGRAVARRRGVGDGRGGVDRRHGQHGPRDLRSHDARGGRKGPRGDVSFLPETGPECPDSAPAGVGGEITAGKDFPARLLVGIRGCGLR